MSRLILASGSPRRRELLAALGCEFEVEVPDIPEPVTGDAIADARALAAAKASAVAQRRPGTVVIGSDTIVFDDDQLYGKPADAADARAMLRSLRGRTHHVVTGLACVRGESAATDHAVADVVMRAMPDAEVDAYVASGSPLDKAGSYAVQDTDVRPVERFAGCECAIIGLPLWRMARMLRRFGIDANDPPLARCAACPDREPADAP